MSEDLTDTVMCLYNKGPEFLNARKFDCNEFASWHICYEEDDDYSGNATSACNDHFTQAMLWRPVVSFHEFMAACNLPGSFILHDDNRCISQELGLELGWLERVEVDTP